MAEKGSITLHPEKGVNAHMTFCPICSGDGKDIILLGNNDKKYTCSKCNALHYGKPDVAKGKSGLRECQKCGNSFDSRWHKEVIEDWERLPGTVPCDKCQGKIDHSKAEVEAGGVYWRCGKCQSQGVIKAGTDLANAVRKETGIETPNPVGIDLTPESCPICNGTIKPENT